MSQETLAVLIVALQKDEALKAKFAECKRPEEVVEVAKAAGHEISLEDLAESQKKTSLSETELDSIAGGTYPITIQAFCLTYGCPG
jgi:predicted ribosomally synthesized peptide with nif11-like leader